MKQRRIEEEIAQVPSENLDQIFDTINDKGASILKYEFVKKRDSKTGKEKKVLQARRCSARHACMGLETSCHPLETLDQSKVDMSFEYNPSHIEALFGKDNKQQKIQQQALHKAVKIQLSDIDEVIGYLEKSKDLVLIKLQSTHKLAKSLGTRKLAVFIGKKTDYLDLLSQLNNGKYLDKFNVLQVSNEARTHIKTHI